MSSSYCNYTSITIVVVVIVKLFVVLVISKYFYSNIHLDNDIIQHSTYLDIWKKRPQLIRTKIHLTTENALNYHSLSTIHTHHFLVYEENIEVY